MTNGEPRMENPAFLILGSPFVIAGVAEVIRLRVAHNPKSDDFSYGLAEDSVG
jgi:hypothetical protein